MFKAAAVVSDTKRVLKNLDGQGLTELRAMQKPDNEIEDLLAAIIIIGKYICTRSSVRFSCRTFFFSSVGLLEESQTKSAWLLVSRSVFSFVVFSYLPVLVAPYLVLIYN